MAAETKEDNGSFAKRILMDSFIAVSRNDPKGKYDITQELIDLKEENERLNSIVNGVENLLQTLKNAPEDEGKDNETLETIFRFLDGLEIEEGKLSRNDVASAAFGWATSQFQDWINERIEETLLKIDHLAVEEKPKKAL